MVDPKQPTTTVTDKEELKDAVILQELQELLDDKEEYHW